tara:strand:- start:30 stop:203 length:174 start_codon:yes stop_codon:yes gene_type:complete
MNAVSQLRATRRYITAFLITVDLSASEMKVSTLLTLLDHLCDNPQEYKDLITNARTK